MLTRYGRYRGNKIHRGGPKLALLPCSSILAYQGLEEENLDQKSPGPPGWGVDAAGQPPAHRKKKIAKKPIRNIIVKWVQKDVETLYNLLNK